MTQRNSKHQLDLKRIEHLKVSGALSAAEKNERECPCYFMGSVQSVMNTRKI